MALLQIQNLRTYFRTTGEPLKAVDGISFALDRGETLGLVGESGCGKSLTALSIVQLIPRPGYIAGGSVCLNGQDVVKLRGPARRAVRGRDVSMIFQEPMTSLNPVLCVRTQLFEAIRRRKRLSESEATEKAIELLRLVGMPRPADRLREYPHQLSGGMMQRVMIAMALSCEPSLLIADEPTTALDVTVEAQILKLLRDLQERTGAAILFITHDLAVVSEMASRVAVMYAGKIVETAPTAELFDMPLHPYTAGLLQCRPSRAQRRQQLTTIKGIVPAPEDFAPGCRFCDRCPHVFEQCQVNEPALDEVASGHAVACYLYANRQRPTLRARPSETMESTDETVSKEEVLLEAQNVVKHFPIRKGVLQRVVGHVKAVDGVDLTVRRGITTALVGESGCGKTTLGKTLIRLLPPTSGTIRFDGIDLAALSEGRLRRMRRRAQIVFQDPYSSLNPRMMVREIIEEGMRCHGIREGRSSRLARIRELLRDVGLPPGSETSYPHEFSGGQRQRISIARVLALEPDFVVCDEPTSALDVSIQAQILNLLQRLQDRFGLTYLFITHDLGVVECVADDVAVMYLGRILERSATEPLFDDPLHPYTQTLLSSIPGKRSSAEEAGVSLDKEAPSPTDPPPGCHFHLRCPHAMPVCREMYPPPTDLGSGRIVHCYLHGGK